MSAQSVVSSQRKQITTPDGTVAELIETRPASPPRRGSARTKARKRALDILFEAELRGIDATEVLAAHTAAAEPEVRPFTRALVVGVSDRQAEIDSRLVNCLAAHWTLSRMPRVDRCLARIALWELLDGSTSGEVVIEQAVALAQELSTEDSATFLNGVLAHARANLADSP